MEDCSQILNKDLPIVNSIRTCPKCALDIDQQTGPGPELLRKYLELPSWGEPEDESEDARIIGEHKIMQVTCSNCGYRQYERPADQARPGEVIQKP